PLRQLLGGVNGKMLKISAGMDTTYSYTYEVSDVYRPEKMYEIAFVQNDATHEVLQSGSTLESFSLAVAPGSLPPLQIIPSNRTSTNLQLKNTTSEELTF